MVYRHLLFGHGRFRRRWRRPQILQFCGDCRRIRRGSRPNQDMHTPYTPVGRPRKKCKIWGRRHLLRNRPLVGYSLKLTCYNQELIISLWYVQLMRTKNSFLPWGLGQSRTPEPWARPAPFSDPVSSCPEQKWAWRLVFKKKEAHLVEGRKNFERKKESGTCGFEPCTGGGFTLFGKWTTMLFCTHQDRTFRFWLLIALQCRNTSDTCTFFILLLGQ